MKLILSFAAALAAAGGGYALYSNSDCAAGKSCCDHAAVVQVVEAGLVADAIPTECEKACEGKTDCDPADCDPVDCDPADCDPAACTEGELAGATQTNVVGNVDAAAMTEGGGSGLGCGDGMASDKPACTKAKTCDKPANID